MSDVEYDNDGDPIHNREKSKGIFNPNEYILSNEHLTILGGTQSGKTNHAIYYLRAKAKQNNRTLFITAKPERKYRQVFDVQAEDGENAVQLMLRPDPETKRYQTVLWDLDINGGIYVRYIFDLLGDYLR